MFIYNVVWNFETSEKIIPNYSGVTRTFFIAVKSHAVISRRNLNFVYPQIHNV